MISAEHLKHLSDLTLELVRIYARHCPWVCVENLAPEILEKLIAAVEEK